MIENKTYDADLMIIILKLEFLYGSRKKRQTNGSHELRLYRNDDVTTRKVSCIGENRFGGRSVNDNKIIPSADPGESFGKSSFLTSRIFQRSAQLQP